MSQDNEAVANTVSGDVSGTVVQAGSIAGGLHVHHHHHARPIASLPLRVGVVPPRAAAFQQRVVTDTGPVTVLSGLGGVGKTQLAVEWAERAWSEGEIQLLVWVTAGSREAIVSSYVRAATRLTGVEEADPQALLEWLAAATVPWLVVLDDLRAPVDLSGLWPPVSEDGRVVVTTRRRDAALRGYRRQLVEVGAFSTAEAVAYMHSAHGPLDGAEELVRDLGFLPLALAQASAYMQDRQLTCAEYRARLAERRLVAMAPDELPDEHRATVAATWSLSVEQADRMAPAGVARPLLDVASVLDPNAIPMDVFTAPSILDLLVDAHDARDGLGCLRRLSLISLESSTVRVHALVQRATRDAWSEEHRARVVHAAASALLHVWPAVQQDTVLTGVLRANADALNAAGGVHLWQPDCHEVLFRPGRSLGDSGLTTEARDYYDRLRQVAHRRLGPDHPDTLIIRQNLAHWRGEAGDPAGAVTELEQLHADMSRVFGTDHPYSLVARNNLARARGAAGDSAGAAVELELLLADRLRVLGADDPDTLATRANLAFWKGEAGDPAGAVTAFEELLVARAGPRA